MAGDISVNLFEQPGKYVFISIKFIKNAAISSKTMSQLQSLNFSLKLAIMPPNECNCTLTLTAGFVHIYFFKYKMYR